MDFIHGFDWDESITEAWWTSAGMPTAPSLYIDFSRASARRANLIRTPDQLMSFTRNSAATFIDGSGKIQTAAINTPRYDWRTGRRGLLIGAGTTNLCKSSEDFSQSPWVNTGAVSVAPVALGNGLMGVATAGYPSHAIYDEIGGAWIIPAGARPAPDSTGRASVTFTAPAGCTSIRIHPLRNADNSAFIRQVIAVTPGATYTLSWYEIGGILGGVQLETGSIATAYIPSGAVAGTRAADVASFDFSGIDLSGGYSAAMRLRVADAATWSRLFSFDSGNADTSQAIYLNNANRLSLTLAGTSVIDLGLWAPMKGAEITLAFSVSPTGFHAVLFNGAGASFSGQLAAYAAPSRARLGANTTNTGQPLSAHYYKLALWAQPMSPADLQTAWGAIQ